MLELACISKTFNPGTVNEKKALSGVALRLEKGDFVTIVGSNGAGKSTLFNAIAGAFYVDEGAIPPGGGGHHLQAGVQAQPGNRAAVSGPHAGGRRLI